MQKLAQWLQVHYHEIHHLLNQNQSSGKIKTFIFLFFYYEISCTSFHWIFSLDFLQQAIFGQP